jgi:hypothetical protein
MDEENEEREITRTARLLALDLLDPKLRKLDEELEARFWMIKTPIANKPLLLPAPR